MNNYRGIAILSSIPKLFEALVKKKLDFCIGNIISPFQHGFFKNRSTSSNLMIFSNFLYSNISSSQIDVIYTDFSKAFDRIDHSILLNKLAVLNIDLISLKWIASYLFNRKQYVRVANFCSDIFNVTSGVPQGSHIGPVLFNLFINDVVNCFNFANCLMYADDLKIYATIKSISDCDKFQDDVDRFGDWSHDNKLLLNVKKCKLMTFCRNKTKIEVPYVLYDEVLERVCHIRDLGVIFSHDLSFSRHIDQIVCKANSMLGMIKRNAKDFHDPLTLKTLYMSYVRSNLEYASVIWSPYYEVHSKRIESVQKQFLLYSLRRFPSSSSNINNFILEPYVNRLLLFNMRTLSQRREIAYAVFTRDVICNKVDCPELLSLFTFYAPTRISRTRDLFKIPYRRTNYLIAEPVLSCMKYFNENYDLFDFNITRDSFKLRLIKLINFSIIIFHRP